jgi:hypothetical protein
MLPGIVGGFLALMGGILIRKGQRGGGTLFMVAGVLVFACYGVVLCCHERNLSAGSMQPKSYHSLSNT